VADSADDLLTGPAPEVAPRLLGATLQHGGVTLRLTEVEAYAGATDPGSHAYRGRTTRNAVMFGPAGHLYCYFVYGMHVCANLVTGPAGEAGAVLLRAGEVIDGLDLARSRRPGARDLDLARGPARLCQALGITLETNGEPARLTVPVSPLDDVRTGPRVGLRQAAERPWRFWIDGEPTVSAYRPAKPRTGS
jgi:DNA-3-methyladenine glycosylase